MKRFVVVGLGAFGSAVARRLYENGHEVIAVDNREKPVDDVGQFVTRAVVGDAREADLLARLGARHADCGIVSVGEDFAASVLATLALKDLGVKQLFVKVTTQEQARVLEKLGVTETIFPERDSAYRLAERLSGPGVLNYVPLAPGVSLREIAVPERFIGKTLRELQLPQRQTVQVVAVRDVLRGDFKPIPDPDEPLKDSDTLVVVGNEEALDKLTAEA